MLQNGLLIRSTWAMSAKSEAFYFDCQHCGLSYLAEQRERPAQMSGTVACVDCKKPAYQWTGFFDVTDLRVRCDERSKPAWWRGRFSR
jgi:putative methionine-R-sulfoxide reductase with GAF domain